MTFEEFEAEGLRLFGEERKNWAFVCPVCKTRQTIFDYKRVGAPPEAIAYSCIGRWMPKEETQRAFNVENTKKFVKGKPCDYTGAGLLNVNPMQVDENRYFNFAEA